ncbi:hypothetical protein SVIO_028020 [Streptomyces violaceusniger]|uniref:Uncharacterized protein n=1 Tax=Streptomyces violaceusniger TaxID=68280 RepID=A0A4D4L2A4_STRVO|nr:hypothetical protein SVIO_028020 [Streptomyces violaceusniger]
MVNQQVVIPASTTACPRASHQWLLPVPDGPTTQKFSRRLTHSRLRRAIERDVPSILFRLAVEHLSSEEVRIIRPACGR